MASRPKINLHTKPFFLTLKRKKGLIQPASKQLKIIHTLFKVEVIIITLMSVMFLANNR